MIGGLRNVILPLAILIAGASAVALLATIWFTDAAEPIVQVVSDGNGGTRSTARVSPVRREALEGLELARSCS